MKARSILTQAWQLMTMVMVLAVLSSCVENSPRDITSSAQTTGGTTTSTETSYAFEGETRNFFYAAGARIFDTLAWKINTNESHLLWGLGVQTTIQQLPESTKVCLLYEFKNTTPSRVLALSAVRRRQILNQSTTNVTVSYYWLVYPDDNQRNQQDCLTTGIINIKNQIAGASAALKFSVGELCTDCASSPLSQSITAYTNSGSVLPNLDLSGLRLRVNLASSGTGNGQSCSSNSACAAIGFNCCLEGQCVNDRAVRSNIDQSLPGFLSALSDVTNNPTRYQNYPQYFYICPNIVAPPNSEVGDATDPEFEAQKLFNEMRDLHRCLNPQFDEISYCSLRFPKASTRIRSLTLSDRIFGVNKDDNNLQWSGNTNLNSNSIFALRYGEVRLYEEGVEGLNLTSLLNSHALQNNGNGTLADAQTVEVTKKLPVSAKDDTLVITYKVDGTCERLSSTLARCRKTYVQGQVSTIPRPSDHPTSLVFNLPPYAATDGALPPAVKVNGTFVASEPGVTWEFSPGTPSINFTANVFPNQTVEITYYVKDGVDDLTASRIAAQTRINTICGCGPISTLKCNLVPKVDTSSSSVVDYTCQAPAPPEPEAPLYQQFYLSAKSVPVRYHDAAGISWDDDVSDGAPTQEGIEFNYTNNDGNRPNNVSSYVGFHEIYGSFNKKANAPRPPKTVKVTKGQTYDIYVDSGGFSSCVNCGNDPYQTTLKLFPQTFSNKGAGFTPDRYNTSRRSSTGLYRADDLLFGRACFVPATMIPWTHATGTTALQQRQRRMAAQHFLFSNGYTRDWYGFDYGSVIGSFDGVTWFAVGNQRRITAGSNRLYLAVNVLFGDQTVADAFKVTVQGDVPVSGTGSLVTHDSMSDGAECQKSHYCSTDDDCIRQLGYDYSCQNVSGIQTKIPEFDALGVETVGSKVTSLATILKGTNGQARRCVYRGRGAPCETNLASLSASGSFNGSDTVGLAACSPNHYCAAVDTSSQFNTAIARFASSPGSQNTLAGQGIRDTYGISARIIGRPLDYHGSKSATAITSSAWSLASTNLGLYLKNSANVEAVCIPGRALDATSVTTNYDEMQYRIPSSTPERADRIFGVGAAVKVDIGNPLNSNQLAMCPATSDGTYLHHNPALTLNSADVAIAQNISSSIYDLPAFSSMALFNTTNGSAALTLGYQRNSCLRAAGAACFSDLECAPSEFVASKMKALSSWGDLANNEAEKAFLREELICGNPEPASLFSGVINTKYDIKQNKCCRQLGKTAQIFTQFDDSADFINCAGLKPAVAGVNIDFNEPARNSRNHTIYDKATCIDPSSPSEQAFPGMVTAKQRCFSGLSSNCSADTPLDINYILNQYKTLDLMNSRTCCTGHWVRSFATENGGGHTWGSGKTQEIDKKVFFAWNWYADQKFTTTLDETENLACSAANFGTLACEIRSLTDAQGNNYLKWIDRFELVGIPQVLIPFPTADTKKLVDSNQASLELSNIPLDDTITPAVVSENKPDVVGPSTSYLSATSYNKMSVGNGKLKKVFSENEFNCCVPAGGSVPQGSTAGTCCTGTLTDQNGALRCCLGDFSDVTVYLNRYVSSEGRGLEDSRYDKETGYLKNPADVLAMAQARNLCCSGKIVTGRAISTLLIPLQGGTVNAQASTRRFAYRSDAVDNNTQSGAIGDIYDAGLRWNNHYYCAPASYVEPTN